MPLRLADTTRAETGEESPDFDPCHHCNRILWNPWQHRIYTRRGDYPETSREKAVYRSPRAGNLVCFTCFRDRYFQCSCCARKLRNTKRIHIIPPPALEDRPQRHPFDVCEACKPRYYVSCGRCDESLFIDNALPSTYHNRLCQPCYAYEYPRCAVCNEITDRRTLGPNHACQRCNNLPQRALSETFERNPFHRTVGIELEFVRYDSIPLEVAAYGGLKIDGSVRPQNLQAGRGEEFVSHITNGDRALQIFTDVCRYLRRRKCFVNNTCGFHVHLDVRELTDPQRANIVSWWCHFENVWFSFVPYNRHESEFCVRTASRNRAPASSRRERYLALNHARSFVDHGTFECRLHSGTLDPIKVTSWVMALLYFFHEAKNAPCTISPESETRAALIAFFRFTKMPLHLRKHLIIRARKFAHVTLSHKPRKRTLSSFLSSTIPLDPPAISTRTPWIITTDPLEHP